MHTHPLLASAASPVEVTRARIVFAVLAVQFIAPALSYLATPELALATLDQVNRALGGDPYTPSESRGHVWHMLAVGNVMTLGFMCALLAVDLRRWFRVLPPLAFLKGFSALFSLGLALTGGPPLFFAVFLLDGATTAAMLVFGLQARRAWERADGIETLPLWVEWLVIDRERLQAALVRAHRAGLVDQPVRVSQIANGIMRMWTRLLFRSDTVGTSTEPVRPNWRARVFSFRAVRLPFLLAEGFVAPFDFSGLLSSPERIARHLLGAHHQPRQVIYDLELLSMHEGALEALEAALTQLLATSESPRGRWLKDLCVHERYHEDLLTTVRAFRAGRSPLTPGEAMDPDLTLRGYLAWCAST